MPSNKEILKSIKVGDVITADLLNRITSAINRNTKAVHTPREVQPKTRSNSDYADPSIPGGGPIGDEVFNSTSVTETTVIATDSGGDTTNIERVDQVVLEETTTGRTITLNITYP